MYFILSAYLIDIIGPPYYIKVQMIGIKPLISLIIVLVISVLMYHEVNAKFVKLLI